MTQQRSERSMARVYGSWRLGLVVLAAGWLLALVPFALGLDDAQVPAMLLCAAMDGVGAGMIALGGDSDRARHRRWCLAQVAAGLVVGLGVAVHLMSTRPAGARLVSELLAVLAGAALVLGSGIALRRAASHSHP